MTKRTSIYQSSGELIPIISLNDYDSPLQSHREVCVKVWSSNKRQAHVLKAISSEKPSAVGPVLSVSLTPLRATHVSALMRFIWMQKAFKFSPELHLFPPVSSSLLMLLFTYCVRTYHCIRLHVRASHWAATVVYFRQLETRGAQSVYRSIIIMSQCWVGGIPHFLRLHGYVSVNAGCATDRWHMSGRVVPMLILREFMEFNYLNYMFLQRKKPDSFWNLSTEKKRHFFLDSKHAFSMYSPHPGRRWAQPGCFSPRCRGCRATGGPPVLQPGSGPSPSAPPPPAPSSRTPPRRTLGPGCSHPERAGEKE